MSTSEKWQQFIVVEGKALRRLSTFIDLSGVNLQGGIAMKGVGPFFHAVKGIDFEAGCYPAEGSERGLSDLRAVVDFLINESFVVEIHAARDEAEAL